jgi:hypothetical protein
MILFCYQGDFNIVYPEDEEPPKKEDDEDNEEEEVNYS